ncbi:FAD-binding oxidoreductase (plasmid) [Streptomyces globisporus]|uniref:FAD-binding oxidoreductase n=1 Tax=Streptomyces globisporus TaxID=1908 RepID=UPI002F90D73C|nr:FAD-binding oxidoreductase [Streptomyces globisporus]
MHEHPCTRTTASPLTPDAVGGLAANIDGSVLTPSDEGFASAAVGFNLRGGHRPALVVAAASAGDVQAAVSFAVAHGMALGVMTTGHQPFPADDGFLLLTMREMRTVEIDSRRHVAKVGAGAVWSDVIGPAQAVGLAPVNGSAPDVGVVGFTLGGGHSPFLGRRHGWAVDRVVSIEAVTADGVLRRVSADSDPDLFWALRGGRSNFGVVTELEIELFPVTSFYGGGIYFEAEHLEAVLRTFPEVVRDAPDDFTCSVAVMNMPPVPEIPEPFRGRALAHVRVVGLGTDQEVEKQIAPFRAIGTGIVDTIGWHPYAACGSVHSDPEHPFPYEERSTLLSELPAKAVDRLAEIARQGAGGPVTILELRHFGGALNHTPENAAPVAAREAAFSVWGVTVGPPEAVAAGYAELDRTMESMSPWSIGRVSTNFAARENSAEDIFGKQDLERLRTLKRRHDPANVFRVNNHNIAPR